MRRDLFFGPLQDRISRCFILLAMLLSVGVWGQTVFSENMGTPSGTTSIAANTFQNSSTLTYSVGEQANPADVRNTTVSTAYSGASGGGNVWFTTTNGAYGFSIESINASTFTSLNLQFGYYKNSGSAHATFSVDYYNGTSWVTLVNTSATLFNESATATAGWYLSKSISLPAAAQISGLKIRFVKTGTNGIRIDDVKLTGTALPAGKTVAFNNNGGTGTMSNQTASTATNLTANTFTRTGYNFINWNTAADASGAFYNNSASYPFTADATMYAQWKGNVTYNANGGSGTVTDSNDYSPNAPVTTQANAYTYPGFTFAGWNTQADGLGTNYAASTASAFNFNGNITLYAKWSSAYSITFANLQFPGSHTMTEGNTFEVYGQAYAAGLTEGAGAGAGIFAEVGYNTSNTNPNTAGWIWVSAPFSSQQGNNDEFKAVLGAGLTPGTYYYATRYKIGSGGNWVYGGYNSNTPTAGGIWNGTSNVNGVLNINADVVDFANFQYQASGNIVLGANHDVYGQVYEPGITPGAGQGNGITAEVGYSLNANTNPNTWTNWLSANYNPSVTGNNDEYTRNIGADLSLAGTYYMAFRYKKAGSSTWVYGGTNGIWNNDSAVLTVQTPQDINIKQGTDDILTNGTYTFGNQASGSTGAAVVFTIQNIGQTNLNLTGAPKIVKSGTNAAEFTVDETTTTSPVTGNSSTTFTVTFSPTSLGAKTAQLSIANNDAIGNENPYIINLTGTGTASATSNIITNTAFAYSPINYLNYINSNITLANSFELGQFIIQDGGGSADADNLATTLSSLSLSVGNFANLEKLAIYDGSIEVAEVTAASTTTFPTLSLTAADGGTKAFSIRGSFKSTVTDNQRITLTVSSATAAVTGSTFGSITATTSNTGTDNVIQVVADRLAFTTQPTSTGINAAMSNVVVSATDINNNKDLDYSGNVSITSTGTLTGSPVIVATTSGAATFSGLTHTVLGTGLSLSATSTGLASATSSAFDIMTIAYVNGDYRTIGSGNWISNNAAPAIWQQYNGSSWQTSNSPNYATTNNVYIEPTHTITATGSFSNSVKLNIKGIFNVSASSTTGSIHVYENGILNVNAALTNNGNFEVENNATVNISYSTASGTAAIWNGNENFHSGSIVNIKNWNYGASAAIKSLIQNPSIISPNVSGFYFGNLTISGDLTGTFPMVAGNQIVNLCENDFMRTATGSNIFFTTSSGDITIGGNMIVTAGQVSLASTTNGNPIVNIDGNLTATAGTVNVNQGSSANALSTLNLKGNLEIASTATLLSTDQNSVINFTGIIQTIDVASTSTNRNNYIDFNVKHGSYVQLANRDFELGTNSKFTVENGGTLHFGFNGSTALNLTRVSGTSGQSFNATTGSTLKISSPDGISNGTSVYTGNVQIGATQADRVFDPAATYHFIGKANAAQVVANGVDQISGNGLPSDASAKNIIVELNTGNSTQDDVSFKALGINKFTNTGSLKIIKGTVIDEAGNGFADGTAEDGKLIMTGGRYKISRGGTQPSIGGDYNLTGGVVEFAGSSAIQVRTGSTPKEYLNVEVSGTNVKAGTTDTAGLTFQSGGKFTVKGTGIFKVPNADGFSGGTTTAIKNTNTPTINLESLSTVDYTGANQTITVDQPYQNLNISGTGSKSPVTNLTVNNITSVTAGTLKILETADDAMPNVFTSKKGVQIGTSGNLILANNTNLMQDDSGVSNSGSIIAQRIAKLKFESIAKADYNYWSSPVKDQKLLYNTATPLVISFSPGTPNNRIFEYKESNDTFVATTNPNFVAGKGYAIRAENAQNGSTYTADGTSKIFEFLGEPNNGNISTPSLTWKDASHGYNVIGNPYPSNINFDSFWSANQSRMYNTAYFWTNNQYTPSQQGSGYTGSNYAIYNGTGGNSAAYQVTSGSPVVPNEYIKPGQGFIVQTKSAGVLNFNNSMREVGVSPFFNNKTNSSKNRFWLSFTSPSSIVNDILVGYIQGASNGFEKDFDAPLLVEGSDSFFSILGAQKLAIQGRNALFTMDDVIPVGTKYFENGIYKIALSQKEGLFESQNIYLKDKLLNKTVNLTSGDYTFTAVKGTDATRFEIVYKDSAVLGTDTATRSDFIVYKDGSDYVIRSSKVLGKVEVYDTAGRMLVSKKTTKNNIRLNAATLTNGVYIIKAENSGDVRTKKVIK